MERNLRTSGQKDYLWIFEKRNILRLLVPSNRKETHNMH